MNLPTLNTQPRETESLIGPEWVDLHSVFYTLQGEGRFAGHPAVFVRLAGCNLMCPLCFGVGTKSRIPYLHKSIGPKIRLDKVKEGEVILTFDSDFNMVETTVKKIIKRKVKKWLKLTIDDKKYDVTPEHPFFTNRGLIPARELEVGDEILEARPEEIIAYKKMGDRNPMKDPEVSARKAMNTNWKEMGEKVSSTIAQQKDEGIYKHSWERLTPKQRRKVRRKQRLAKLGNKNPNWKGEEPNLKCLKQKINTGEIIHCSKCSRVKNRLLVHHIDEDHSNDAVDNLTVWCHRCHNRFHERGYNFWNGKRSDGKELVNKHNGQMVQKIRKRKGELPVINLSCFPHNTYLANRMWVHNCDTDYTTDRKTMPVNDAAGLAINVWSERTTGYKYASPNVNNKPLIVITGGEPFRQPSLPFLVKGLVDKWFHVQIETNGTMWQEHEVWNNPNVTIVCSPKTPKLHPSILRHVADYKYVLDLSSDGSFIETDGLPNVVLGASCHVARPHQDFQGRVYVQAQDSKDEAVNKENLQGAAQVAMNRGYILSVQTHKLAGLE